MTLTSSIRETAGEYQIFIVARAESGGFNFPRFVSSYSGDDGDQWIAPNFIFQAPHDNGTPLASDPEWFFMEGNNHVLQDIAIASDSKFPGINQFKGYIGEVLIFDRKLSGVEFETVVDYIANKWGLPALYEPPQNVSLEPRLRDLGDALGLDIGSITRDNFFNFPETQLYQDTLGENFGILTTGNAAKYGPLSTGQGTYDFSTLDQHFAVAEAYNMKFHGHVFVWHSQLPGWLSSGTWTRQQLIDILNDHIDQVGGYLKGKVAVWDVVNEPFNDDGSWRPTIWNDTIDPDNTAADKRDYIDLAFQRARQVDPDAKLILNDFANDVINAKSDALYAWAQSMIAREIPIDGVGFQMHLSGAIDYDSFAQNMQRFADLGLEVHITELDVRVQIPFTTDKSLVQADVYRQVLRRVLAQPAVKTFTLWGFTDAHSWIPDFFPGTDSGLIFDKDYNPKHAFVALQEELFNALSADGLKTRLLGQVAQTPEADLDKDLDGDGLSNLFEIAMELDPSNPDFEKHPVVQISPGQTSAEFTPRKLTTDIELRVEISQNMKDWETLTRRAAGSEEWEVIKQGIDLVIDPVTGKVSVTDTSIAIPTFVRIIAVQITDT
jgi:GH35 family endo-1,4-beta-xylanase